MRKLRLPSLLLILLGAFAAPASAQQIGQMTRVAPTTGLADSTLFACTDSTKVFARACKFSDIQKRLAFKAFDSLMATYLRADTIRSQAGASKQLVVQTTTSGSALTTAVRFNAIQQALFPDGASQKPTLSFAAETTLGIRRISADHLGIHSSGFDVLDIGTNGVRIGVTGSAGTPALSFSGSTTTGLYRYGADTLGITTGGVASLGIRGGASPTIFGGAGSMTIQAGTGNSRTMTLQSTTSAGTAKNALLLGADSSVTAIGQLFSKYGAASCATPQYAAYSSGAAGFGSGIAVDTASSGGVILCSNGSNRAQTTAQGLQANGTGSAAAPNYRFLNSTNSGLYYINNGSSDTTGIGSNGVASQRWIGNTWVGGDADLTVQAGVGASRLLTLQSTRSTGASVSNIVLAEAVDTIRTSSAGSNVNNALFTTSLNDFSVAVNTRVRAGDGNSGTATLQLGAAGLGLASGSGATDTLTIVTNGSARLKVASNAATGAGDVAVCLTTINVITKGATCGTSSAKVKTNFASIFDPVSKTMALQPTRYSYIPGMYGGRTEYGLVADSTMAVDPTLVFKAESDQLLPNGLTIKKGDALNVNDRAVLSLLIATVQQQQRQIDSLRVTLTKKEKP